MKIKSHTSDSSFSWINGNLSVYISALSSTKVTLKFADFSAGAFSSYRFLARNPKTKEDISIPFAQIDLCTFQLDLLPFQEYFQFKRHSEFILTLSCVASAIPYMLSVRIIILIRNITFLRKIFISRKILLLSLQNISVYLLPD